MDNIILLILPLLLLVALYMFVLTRKGEMQRVKVSFKGHDWLTFLGVVIAVTVLISPTDALSFKIPFWLWFVLTMIFILFVIFAVIYKARSGKAIIQRLGDERLNEIYAKSSRNALFTTYLGFAINMLVNNTIAVDAMWVTIILGSGLAVLMASIFFYYYLSS